MIGLLLFWPAGGHPILDGGVGPDRRFPCPGGGQHPDSETPQPRPDRRAPPPRSRHEDVGQGSDAVLQRLPPWPLWVVAGFDYRHQWSPSFDMMGTALLLNFLGAALFIWCMVVNPFFSKVVRIQEDRGHRLVQEGPYQMVRHPGYLGFILQWSSVPILLNSFWALLPFALTSISIVIRTHLEDNNPGPRTGGILRLPRARFASN